MPSPPSSCNQKEKARDPPRLTLHAVTLAAEEVVDLTDAPNSQLMLAAILGIAAVVSP